MSVCVSRFPLLVRINCSERLLSLLSSASTLFIALAFLAKFDSVETQVHASTNNITNSNSMILISFENLICLAKVPVIYFVLDGRSSVVMMVNVNI